VRSGVRSGARPALAAGLLILGALLGVPSAARAAPPGTADPPSPCAGTLAGAGAPAPLVITLTRLRPAVLHAGERLEVGGTVCNAGPAPVTGLRLQLSVGPALVSREELARYRAQPAPPPQRVVQGPGRIDAQTELPVGMTRSFAFLPETGDALGLAAERVNGLGVQALGSSGGPGSGSGSGVLGSAATTVGYFPAPISSPVEVALVVPVTAPPGWLPVASASGAAAVPPAAPDDPLVLALAPAGRLARLLLLAGVTVGAPAATPAAPVPPVTLAVDPALVRRVVALAARAGPVSAAVSATATAWLQGLRAAAAVPGVTVSALPYGDADLTSMADNPAARAAGVRLLRDAPATLAGLGQTATSPAVGPVLPADGLLPTSSVDLAAAAGATTAVVSDMALTPPPPAQPPTPTAVSSLAGTRGASLTALVTDARLQDLLTAAATTGAGNPRLAEQDLMAELALVTSEAPNARQAGVPLRRALVLLAPRDWAPPADYLTGVAADLATAPWVRAVSVADATGAVPAVGEPARVRGPAVPTGLFDADVLADGALAAERVATLADLRVPGEREPDLLTPPLAEARDRGWSQWWRADPASGAALRSRVADIAGGLLDQVVFRVNDGGVRLTGVSGLVPVQLRNGLPERVRVRLTLTPATYGQVLPVTADFVLERPRGTALVQQQQLTVTSRKVGRVATALALTTAGGLPVGTPRRLEIVSTAYGVVAIGITAGALTVLVLAFVVRGVRWGRRRRRPAPG